LRLTNLYGEKQNFPIAFRRCGGFVIFPITLFADKLRFEFVIVFGC
jgi:hypothetical protein